MKNELSSIKIGLPKIDKQLYHNREIYHKICISVFEKWLSEDEGERIYETDPAIIASWRTSLENVIKEFYKLTNVYLWRHKYKYRIVFYKPSSLKHLIKRCDIQNQTWRDGHRYDLLLPEYSAVYGEEFDWTNIIWYTDFDKIQPLLEVVKKSGLYILPQ